MPVYQLVEVSKLVEPLNPQRSETLLANIDELRESIKTNGLQQPIGVVALADGNYRIIWGHRRSIAITQLQWDFVPAQVYQPEEADEDRLMGAENYHRNQTNDVEEARYYERIVGKYPDGTIGLSRELNVSQGRVEALLAMLRGNPQVVEALAAGDISLAQASEINKFNTPGYQLHALEMAKVEGKSAVSLRRWRVDIQRNLQDQPQQAEGNQFLTPIPDVSTEAMDTCNLANHQVRLMDRKYYSICNEHWNLILEGLEYWGMINSIKQANLWIEFNRLLAQAKKIEEEINAGRDIGPAT